MSLDGLSLSLLVSQLDAQLRGGRIEKVFQPDCFTIILWVRTPGKTVRLLLSADPRQPRMHIFTGTLENPNNPPAFCMLLRKHLADGRIQSIIQHELDRTVKILIDVREEGGAIAVKNLVVELMGKHSNIILVDADTILDAVRRVGAGMSRHRQVYPGRIYQLPPGQERMNLLVEPVSSLINTLKMQSGALAKAIMNAAMGIGPVTIKEFLWRAKIGIHKQLEDMDGRDWQQLQTEIESIIEMVKQKDSVGHVKIDCTNKLTGISGFRLFHLTDLAYEFPSLSEAVEFASTLIPQAVPEKERLRKFIVNEISRIDRKRGSIAQELSAADAADDLRRRGDILMTFLTSLQPGLSSIELPDIYSEQDVAKVLIELNPLQSPQQNIQSYYNRYNKQKRAQQNLRDQLTQIAQESSYLDSVLHMLDHAQNGQEIREIEQELVAGSYIAKSSKKRPEPISAPLTIMLGDDSSIMVGKNNRQNDIVTFKSARPNDLWFHTKDIPGSHVILRTLAADSDRIRTAAMVAAYFSKARQSSNVPVDYTLRRYVKKPSGAKPGFVIYEKQTTLYVTPEEHVIAALLQKTKR